MIPRNISSVVNTIIDRRTVQRFEDALIAVVDGQQVDIRPSGSSIVLRNVDVIGSIDDLEVGQEVQIIWKDDRPYVLSASTADSLVQYFPPDNITIENSSEGISVKRSSLQVGHLAFSPAMSDHRHEDLEGAITFIGAGPGIAVSGSTVSIAGNVIMRYNAGGALAEDWPANADGLDQALETARCGDVVEIPAGQLIASATGVVIPAGVTLRGVSKTKSIIRGSIYGGDNSVLENCSVWVKDSDSVELIGIYGPAAGEMFRATDVIVTIENKHNISGDAYGAYATQGLLRLESCSIEAISLSGTAWAGWGSTGGEKSTLLAINCHIDENTPWFAGGGVSVYNCLLEERTANLFCDYADPWLYVATQAYIARTQNPLAPDPTDVHWENLTDVITGTVLDLAIDPVDRDVAWCSTSTGFWGTSNLRAAVVSWTLLMTPAQFQAALGHSSLVYPRGLATTRVASGTVWVFLDPTGDGVGKGVWVGRYNGSWNYTDQIFAPGGQMNSDGTGPIAVSPYDSSLMWIAWCKGAVSSGNQLAKSIDGGASWAVVDTTYDDFLVAYRILIPSQDNEDGDVVYVSCDDINPLVTTDGGTTWTNALDPGGCNRSYVFDVGNEDRDRQIAAVTGGTLYISENGGTSWTSRGAVGAQKTCLYEAESLVVFFLTTSAPWASIDFGLTLVDITGDYVAEVGVFTNVVAITTVAD